MRLHSIKMRCNYPMLMATLSMKKVVAWILFTVYLQSATGTPFTESGIQSLLFH
jgi:hypothetical protein